MPHIRKATPHDTPLECEHAFSLPSFRLRGDNFFQFHYLRSVIISKGLYKLYPGKKEYAPVIVWHPRSKDDDLDTAALIYNFRMLCNKGNLKQPYYNTPTLDFDEEGKVIITHIFRNFYLRSCLEGAVNEPEFCPDDSVFETQESWEAREDARIVRADKDEHARFFQDLLNADDAYLTAFGY